MIQGVTMPKITKKINYTLETYFTCKTIPPNNFFTNFLLQCNLNSKLHQFDLVQIADKSDRNLACLSLENFPWQLCKHFELNWKREVDFTFGKY